MRVPLIDLSPIFFTQPFLQLITSSYATFDSTLHAALNKKESQRTEWSMTWMIPNLLTVYRDSSGSQCKQKDI